MIFKPIFTAYQKKYLSLLIPIFIGVGGFFLYIGPIALNPFEIQWLGIHDFLQSYFGWEFFRSTEWTNPLGGNPRYGYDVASSIVYSDSIPLFAIPFKVISSILPTPFQYFGIWLLCCYILQAIIGWEIVGIYTNSFLYRMCVTLLLIGSPIILWQLDLTHIALAGHFVILCAIYLNLTNPKYKPFLWALTIIGAALIHFYLLVMVIVLWAANLLDELMNHRSCYKQFLTQFFFTVAALLICAWQAGYFMVGFSSVSDNSFGNYAMNLFSIFDSRGYSLFFKGIPQQEYFDEGFNYIGAGGMLLLIASLPSIWILRKQLWQQVHTKLFLCLSLIVLLLLSLTHQLHYGDKILHIPLPPPLISFLSVIRCSGRLFWPLYYFLLFVPSVLILKSYKRSIAFGLLILAVPLQFADITPLREKVRRNLMHPPHEKIGSNLHNEFWNIAAQKYQLIIARPVGPYHKSWATFGDFVAKNNMATNIVCLARVDTRKIQASQEHFDKAVYEGQANPSALYIIENVETWKLRQDTPPVTFNKNTDLLVRIDGYTILAPQWKTCEGCQRINLKELELKNVVPKIQIGQELLFNKKSKNNDLFLLAGWHFAENWGIWANGNTSEAIFALPTTLPYPKFFTLELNAFVNSKHPNQEIEIWSNGILQIKRIISKPEENLIEIPIPADAYKKGYLRITIRSLTPQMVSKVIPGSGDTRELSVGLVKAYFH